MDMTNIHFCISKTKVDFDSNLRKYKAACWMVLASLAKVRGHRIVDDIVVKPRRIFHLRASGWKDTFYYSHFDPIYSLSFFF